MTSKLRQVYKSILIVILFAAGLILAGIVFPIINYSLDAKRSKDNCNTLKRWWLIWFAKILNLKIKFKGKISKTPALVISNHISWMDIVVLGHLIPGYFVSKSDVLDWPIIGYLARQGGTVFIRRGDKQQVRSTTEKMLWLLKQNRSILAFPEGTTSEGDVILPFHSSLFQPAVLGKSNIQPVLIQYEGKAKTLAPFIGEDEFITHLFRILALPKVEVCLTILPIIQSANRKRTVLTELTRNQICSSLTEDYKAKINIS